VITDHRSSNIKLIRCQALNARRERAQAKATPPHNKTKQVVWLFGGLGQESLGEVVWLVGWWCWKHMTILFLLSVNNKHTIWRLKFNFCRRALSLKYKKLEHISVSHGFESMGRLTRML
jgi:hypothetical protein